MIGRMGYQGLGDCLGLNEAVDSGEWKHPSVIMMAKLDYTHIYRIKHRRLHAGADAYYAGLPGLRALDVSLCVALWVMGLEGMGEEGR